MTRPHLYVLILLFCLFLVSLARNHRIKNLPTKALRSSYTVISVNNWTYFLYGDGISGITPGGDGGGIYPRETANVIYVDGVWWGGFLSTPQGPDLRVGGQRYLPGTQPGWIVTPGDGTNPPVAVDPEHPRARIYRIRRDWQNLARNPVELRREAIEYYYLWPQETVPEILLQNILEWYRRDWEEWPGDLGAPYYDRNGNGRWDPGIDEPGFANADQVVWCVVNDLDVSRSRNNWGNDPIGLELQITAWAYNDPTNIIGQIIFKRYLLINKSGFTIDSMFIGQWSEPDVGSYLDDFVGCDSVLGIGFGYNSGPDAYFAQQLGMPTPSAGYLLLQGPIVPFPGDTASLFSRQIPDFKNLEMTSFSYDFSYYDDWGMFLPHPQIFYNLLNGMQPKMEPEPVVHKDGPYKGRVTRFPLNGDPVTGEGDLDGRGDNWPPGDRRLLISSGPFTMQPGDSQEIVVAIVGGIGTDYLKSVEVMKDFARFARVLYENRFQGPLTPYPPLVKATPLDRSIVLEWGSDSTVIRKTEQTEMGLGLHFEGYNVYQLPDSTSDLSAAKKIATFDLVNGITRVVQKRYIPEYGYFLLLPAQLGKDNGIRRHLVVDWDYLKNEPIYPGQTYHFAVTSYAVREDKPAIGLNTTESPPQIVSVTAQWPRPGMRYEGKPEQSLPVEHVSGTSEGTVRVTVVDPAAVTGHEYELYFEETASGDSLRWNLRDRNTGLVVLADQPLRADYLPPIVDGLQVEVIPPPQGTKQVAQVAYRDWDQVLDPNLNLSLNSEASRQAGEVAFFLNAPGAANPAQNLAHWTRHNGSLSHDLVIEFPFGPDTAGQVALNPWVDAPDPETGSYYLRGWLSQTHLGEDSVVHAVGRLPLRAWKQRPDGKWEQILVGVKDLDGNWLWNPALKTALSLEGNSNGFEPLYLFDYPYREDSLSSAPGGGAYYAQEMWWNQEQQARHLLGEVVFGMWLDGSTDTFFGGPPSPGTVVRFFTFHRFGVEDVYVFTAPAVKESRDYAREDVERITVFPNPYYAYNPMQEGRFDKFVTFTHLPRRAIIRVFNLAGQLITKIEKNDDSQFLRLPLRNRNGILLGSGIYIAYIEMPELGKEKVVKFVIVQQPDMPRYLRGVPRPKEGEY